MFTDIGSFFTEGFGLLNSQTGLGLGGIVETVGSMFGPIAAGAQSIGSAISSGVVSFFPSIFAGLGTLVTSVGSAMAAMMQAIAAALSSIPIAGWIAAAAAVAGAVALIATIASIASNVSSTQIDEPTPAFQAKKYAKGTRGVKKGQIANVDEKGEELIVRNPDQGRMTYLEKGDGVIPAKETDNLMAIGANPEGWLAKGLAEVTGSAAAGAGMSAQGPNAQLSGAAAAAAAGVGSIFESEYDEILGDTNEFMSGLSDIFKKSDNPIIAAVQSMIYMATKTVYRINAVYDICEYVSGYFRDKQLSDLRPVEIYAMTKVNLEQSVVSDKDAITIKMGNDFTFSDVEEKVLFNEPKIFTGKNYVDTGVSLLSEDRSWVMALDYRIDEGSAANSVIAQCFQTNGMNGFRFWVNNGSKVAWGTESTNGAHLGARDMIVLRHTKGENGIHVYAANTTAAEIGYIQLNRTRTTQTNATLVFGCAKADDGAYERYAKGTIYWGKLWYTDLGDAACRKLAAWTHEDFTFEACGFKRYYLSDNSNKRCSITFIQAGLLGQKMALNTGSTNTGGWADANIRTFLDGRILNALPIGWQQIIKQVKVGSTIGDKSSEVVTADSYFYLPSVAELFPSQNVEPYIYEGTAISFMTDNTSRICNDENGNLAAYWTRSPNAQYGSYFWSVTVTGEYYGFTPANNEQGIRLMFSV